MLTACDADPGCPAVASADPDTGAFVPDQTYYEALYYAVQCADYDVVPEGSSGREQLDVGSISGEFRGGPAD